MLFSTLVATLDDFHWTFPSSTNSLTCLVVACFACTVFVFYRLYRPAKDQFSTIEPQPLHTLLSVLIPTRSTWPSRYQKILSKRHDIHMSLDVLFHDVIAGVIELRNPTRDIALLLRGGADVNGWRIKLSAGARWRWRVVCWMMPFELFADSYNVRVNPFACRLQ